MLRFALSVFVMLYPLAAGQSAGGLTTEQKNAVLDLHNYYRNEVAQGALGDEPGATNMVKLDWNCDLAVSAQAWADRCEFEHSTGNYGENLYATSFSTDNSHTDGVQGWVEEHNDYTFDSAGGGFGTCSAVCGHYTQVVWAETTSVGCGYAICKASDIVDGWPGDNAGFLVCQYSPPGNYPRAPYMDGSPAASACPAETTASGNLCIQNEETTVEECDGGDGNDGNDGGDGDGCDDSPFDIYLGGGDTVSCSSADCSTAGVSSHCPDTCGECDLYECADSEARFIANGKRVGCRNLSKLPPSRIVNICNKFAGASDTCRHTCGVCQ